MLASGQVLKGGKSAYRLLEQLKVKNHILSTLWKAEVLDETLYDQVKLVIVKTGRWERYEFLDRERTAYLQPSIRNSPYIRSMLDEVNRLSSGQSKSKEALQNAVREKPYCLVLEYLNCTLHDLKAEKYKRNLMFVATYFQSMLKGLADINQAQAIWTDAKAENVLCSNVDTSTPIVKMSDMGLTGPTGYDKRQLQPTHTRAPEVWAGLPCTHVADVWSIAATFVSWIDSAVFGGSDTKAGIPFEEAWCIAKLIRGFETVEDKMPTPPQEGSNQEDLQFIQNMNDLGRLLLTQEDDGTPESMHVPARPFFAEVLQKLELPPEVEALLRIILVLDPKKRPTATALLQSAEYQALLAAAK